MVLHLKIDLEIDRDIQYLPGHEVGGGEQGEGVGRLARGHDAEVGEVREADDGGVGVVRVEDWQHGGGGS